MIDTFISLFAAASLLALAAFLLHLERSRSCLYLSAALLVTAVLELLELASLAGPADALFYKRCAIIAESMLPALWVLSSLTFARQPGPWKIGRLSHLGLAGILLVALLPIMAPADAFFYAPDFPSERLLFLNNTGYYYYLWIMACLVFALVNLEKTFINASPNAQYRIKYELIGLGTILAVLVFYYSQALLYRTLNMNYLPVRSFVYLLAAGLAAYSLFCRRGKVRIAVSRQAAFKSVVLVAVAAYLLLLGLLGEGMQHFRFSFPRTVSVSFAFLLGIALLIVLLSRRVRREVKVMLHKNFYQNKHDYRIQWLNFTMQLSTSRSGEELLQRILEAYCEVFGIKGAALFLHDENCGGYTMTSGYQMDLIGEVIHPSNSLLHFMKRSAWVICLKDDNPEVLPDDLKPFAAKEVSFVIPLFDGELIEGFIALGPVFKEDEVYIYEDYDLMKTIARQASLAILHQKLSEQITQAREIEAIGNVATFVAHDLKNHITNLSLIVQNAAIHIANPEFQRDMLVSLGNTVGKMQKLIASLKGLGEKEIYSKHPVNLIILVQDTASLFTGSKIEVAGKDQTVRIDREEIQKVVMNLITNAVEASDPDQQIAIEVGCTTGVPFIKVRDRGCGMTAGFIRHELFKPFSTSKKQGLGIGLYQCRQIVDAHGGRIEVSSVPGSGTEFTVWFTETLVVEERALPPAGEAPLSRGEQGSAQAQGDFAAR